MRIRTLLHLVLVAVILAFVGKIVSTWRRPLPTLSGKVAPEPVSAVSEPPPSLTPEAREVFVTTIAQNDLFSPDRGETPAPTVVDDGPKKVDPPSHLKLVGVVLTRSRAEAFLSDTSQGNKVVRVKQGDSIGQYQLLQVAAAEVKLSLGAGGEVALLQLRLLDSATSQQAPNLIPTAVHPRVGFGRPGPPPGRAMPPPGADPNQPAPAAQAPEEAQALRDNIQRMQQRLRRIRRRAAREEAAAQGQDSTGGGGEEEEQEEESDDEE
jgi:hypothetical protein